MDRKKNLLIWGSFFITLIVWIFQSMHWNSMLDGDSALYSLMSLDVLEGRHAVFTVGQSHGGTPLVYARALLFAVFGPSQFLGFFVNGLVVAMAVALWTRFAFLAAGAAAAWPMGLLGALGSSIFAQYSCTDYYVLSLISGGVFLNLAFELAVNGKLSPSKAFFLGAIQGFSFYVCRFTPLYSIFAFTCFFALTDAQTRVKLVPSFREARRMRGIMGLAAKAVLFASALHFALAVPAFFSADRFFGINAEAALKLAIKLALILWIVLRWRLFLLGSGAHLLSIVAGFVIGYSPDLLYRFLHHVNADRVTGIVRWPELAPLLKWPEFSARLGANFSRPFPQTLGMLAAACAVFTLALGFLSKDASKKRLFKLALLATTPILASWLLIHTYMHFVVQYFYPMYFPLYLCLGLALASSRFKKLCIASILVIASVAASDLHYNWTKPNHRTQSGIFEKLREWDLKNATGDFWSSYDLMWASKGEFLFDPLYASRFPHFQDALQGSRRIGYVYHSGDSIPEEKKRYHVLRSAELANGYRVEMLEKN